MELCKKRRIRSGVALCCTLAVVLSYFPSYATEDIKSLESQTSALENELKGINQDILDLSEKISSTEMQVEILNGDIDKTEDDLKEAEANEEKQYQDMKSRIKYMYEHGNSTLLEMLFSAESMSDFLNKADFIENLSEYDRNALNELKETHQQIADQKEDLEKQKASMDELEAQLKTQKSDLQAKAKATSTDLDDVNAKLKKAKEEEAARLAEEARKKAEAEKAAAAKKAAAEKAAAAKKNTSSSSSDNSGTSGNSNSSNTSGNSDNSNNSSSGDVINSDSTSASTDDVTLLAALLQCEAHYDYDSMLAVATVIMNRVESGRFGSGISGVIYSSGQFAPVWTGTLDRVLNNGPASLSVQVAQDAINGSRLSSVADCYYFLYAASTSRSGVVIGDNVFFTSW